MKPTQQQVLDYVLGEDVQHGMSNYEAILRISMFLYMIEYPEADMSGIYSELEQTNERQREFMRVAREEADRANRLVGILMIALAGIAVTVAVIAVFFA